MAYLAGAIVRNPEPSSSATRTSLRAPLTMEPRNCLEQRMASGSRCRVVADVPPNPRLQLTGAPVVRSARVLISDDG